MRIVFSLAALALALTAGCGTGTPASPGASACRAIGAGTATATGVVTYQNAPVPGVTVAIGDRAGVTAADGTFQIAQLPAGPARLIISAGDLGTADGEVYALDGANTLRLRVVRAYSEGLLTGRIIDACTGSPVAGATIAATKSTVSDSSGYYALDDLCCGTLPQLSVTRDGYSPVTTTIGRIYDESRWLDILLTPITATGQ